MGIHQDAVSSPDNSHQLTDLPLNQILQGDCLELMKQLPDKCVDLVVTDPPYGINFQSAWRSEPERFAVLDNDDRILTDWIGEAHRLTKDSGAIYLFTRTDVLQQWREAVTNAGYAEKSIIVWDRIIHGLGDLEGGYAPQYDLIIFGVKGRHILRGDRPKNILRYQRPNPNTIVHPTQKPIGLMSELIENSSDTNDVILDCFAGSGSTLVAAQKLNRKWIGMEINPEYCKIAQERVAKVQNQDRLTSFL